MRVLRLYHPVHGGPWNYADPIWYCRCEPCLDLDYETRSRLQERAIEVARAERAAQALVHHRRMVQLMS